MLKRFRFLLFLSFTFLIFTSAFAQSKFIPVPLPAKINGVNEEFSGMATYQGRVYLLPQYGSYKETKLNGNFHIYSLLADSIGRVIDGKDTALNAYKTIRVKNLNKLPDSIKAYYEGFEAISIANNTVYLSIETNDTYDYCFLLKGRLNNFKNVIEIDPKHFVTFKRPLAIKNAGFESVTWLPKEKKLLAYYEYNAMPGGGKGYLIDPDFKKTPQIIKVPFLYFRITDITATQDDKIYGINYFWNGDYKAYLSNDQLKNQEDNISKIIPNLKSDIIADHDYLQKKTTSYARIVMLSSPKAKEWQQVTSAFPSPKNNWEGITLFRKGALIITDANQSNKQLSTFGYVGPIIH